MEIKESGSAAGLCSALFVHSRARPANLNVLLHKGMIRNRFVRLACSGEAASWVSSKFECYQGAGWHCPLFGEVGLPRIYYLLRASLWQAV